jgi:hypothetical protein
MKIECNRAFGHPFGGIEVKGTDIDIMFFGNNLRYFSYKTFTIDALYLDPGEEPDRFLVFPFGFDDPFTEFRHQVDGYGAIGAMDLYRVVIIEKTDDIITGNGAAAAGQVVFYLGDVITEHERFGLFSELFNDGGRKGFIVDGFGFDKGPAEVSEYVPPVALL